MEVIKKDLKKGIVKIKITESDDLWYLSHIIDPGDLIKSKTTRKVRIGDADNAKVSKKTLTLKIEAETIEISDNALHLRINGKIKEGPEDIPKDSYHSIALEEGSQFTIEKVQWLGFQKKKLEEASEKKYNYLLCLFDREEAILALTLKKGYKTLVKFKGDVSKKDKKTEIKKDFHQEIIKLLIEYNNRYNPEAIILASPAFYKEELFKKVTLTDLRKKTVLAICSDVNRSAFDEVMKRPELASILKSARAREEKLLIDQLLSEINKENLAVYGWKEVEKAIDAGAISKLLLTDKFIFKTRTKGSYETLDKNLKEVDHLKGEIFILSSEEEGGKTLDGLGGIAAILRYKLEY
jgi:protein pelota